MPELATELAAWVATLRPEDLPPAVIADSRLRVLDTIGVMLAGFATPTGRAVRTAAAALGSGRAAQVAGSRRRSTVSLAALVNGTLAHALDFDDTHNASVMHPSAVSVPTALAVTQANAGSGATAVLGVAIGNEIACRLGMVAPGAFHEAGLHPTSVLGAPASALVAGRLLGLTPAELVSAVGIACSQGAGILEAYSDGTWSKTVHPGWAAHAGIVAAELARAGFSGPATGLDGHYGLFSTHVQVPGYRFDYIAASEGLGVRWHMCDTAFKLFPCAHSIHAFIEGALALRARHGLVPAGIASVQLDIPGGFVGQIAEPRAAKLAPRTPTHARASVLYAVAVALADGVLDARHYTDAAIVRPDLLSLCQKITHRVQPMPDGPISFGGAIEIVGTDGRRFSMTIEEADGTGSRLLSAARVEEKFRANASPVLADAAVDVVVGVCRMLEKTPAIDALLNATSRRRKGVP
jgi:2-methylcitrate dehydratase PrpD